jgi:aldehyde dehydrogenase (NAD+)
MAQIDEKIGLSQAGLAFEVHKKAVQKLRTEPIAERKKRLRALRAWVHQNRPAIHKAMFDDFRKPATEVDGTEIFHVLAEISHALTNLDQWTSPKKVDAPVTFIGTRSSIHYEPRGVCLIISPWNYPFSLAVGPLVSALAAGNAVVIKPSELTPNVAALISRMVNDIFDRTVVTVFEGGPETAQYLLSLPFDHIFFTGSPAIGKVVMKAAAENLASVTLELGGKSPGIITQSANIKEAALRTAVAKFINNGQTCIAPDYILVDTKIEEQFTKELIAQTKKLFATKEGDFETSTSYCRIVNEKHFIRINELIQDALNKGAKLEYGGKTDVTSRFIHPMILTQVPQDARVMEEEIFGPVLPIVPYQSIEEAVRFINGKPKPLALYIFTDQTQVQQKMIKETSAGAVCVNDSAIHFLHHNLPFGGVNNSGLGHSHGYYGFLAFSHGKPVLKQKHGFTTVQPFYPPYTSWSKKIMDWFLKLF